MSRVDEIKAILTELPVINLGETHECCIWAMEDPDGGYIPLDEGSFAYELPDVRICFPGYEHGWTIEQYEMYVCRLAWRKQFADVDEDDSEDAEGEDAEE
jgi:hypothetical protein